MPLATEAEAELECNGGAQRALPAQIEVRSAKADV